MLNYVMPMMKIQTIFDYFSDFIYLLKFNKNVEIFKPKSMYKLNLCLNSKNNKCITNFNYISL